jgi:outer membrane receptor protein involved in Fe transport
MRNFLYLPALACLFVTLSPLTFSETGARYDEEIRVTAEFRDTRVSDLAGSASVILPNEDSTTVHHLEEVLGRAPNVNFASGASRARFFQIRGIGERGQFSTPLNSSVGLIVDGVDLSGIGAAATLFDVQQIEVLRGPQGTLYGANALAGLINVVTPDPSAEQTGSLRFDAGDYGALGVGGILSGPMGEDSGYRISAQRYRDDGFIDNRFLNQDDTNNRDEGTYRAKFAWRSDRSDWRLNLGHINIDNGYDAFSLDNDRNTRSDEPGSDEQTTDYGALALRYDLNKNIDLEASIAYATTDISYGYDEDWTFTGFDPFGYSSTDLYKRDRTTTTGEIRWLSKPGQGFLDGAWDWVAGLYLLDQEVELDRAYTFDAPFSSEFEIQRLAAYGEISRDVGHGWRLSIGARLERHRSEYDDLRGISFEPDDDLFGGRIVAEKTLSNGSLLYGSITRGYKSGGFNIDGTLAADLREFDPETVWNVELGYKTTLANDRLRLRASLFRMDRDDIQISTSTERPIPDSNAVEFIVYTGNAAEGLNQGIEAEFEFIASDIVTIFANLGILDTEYEDYTDNSGRDLDGRRQAHAPEYQYYLGARFSFNEHWTAQVELEGKDEYFFSASHPTRSDRYELLNASLTYRMDPLNIKLWGRNLTDEDYFVRGFFFGNDPRDIYAPRPFTQLGEPARVGISVTYNW